MFNIHKVQLDWGGRNLTLETGRIARQADGAVSPPMARPVCLPPSLPPRSRRQASISFRSPSTTRRNTTRPAGFRAAISSASAVRPEGHADLAADRSPIRPLFAEGWRCDTQVTVTVLSHDQENDPDIVAMVAASAALTLSGAPFMGPIGGARVAFINDEYVLNPTLDEMPQSQLDLVVAGTQDAVMMVESEAKELSEDIMLGAVMFGHRHFQPVIEAIIKLAEKAAKEPRDLVSNQLQ